MHWQQALERLCADRKSGAATLTRKAVRLLARMVKSGIDPLTLTSAVERLSGSHPAMAPLWHLTQLVRQHMTMPSQLVPVLRQFFADMNAHTQAAITCAAEWLPQGMILTHSFSSLVFRALVQACQKGKRIQVVCTASHPGGEGVILAKALAKEGIAVTLVADLQAFAWLPCCVVFLVGADALCVDGLVHKVGTRPLAMTAKQRGVPLWSVATSEKHLPLPWHERMKGEALPVAKISVAQDRTLYDLTEWALVTGVITEEGVKIVEANICPFKGE